MNLEELRSTMVGRAESLEDAPHARVVAVRRRVRVVRRRRRAALAVSVAAAVAAVGVAVVPSLVRQRDVSPARHGAPSRLAGREVPRTQTATGFTYRYAEGHQSQPGQRFLDVDVPLTDTPQLVMWASSDTTSAPVVRLVDRVGDDAQVSAAGGFSRYLWLPTTDSGRHVERLRLTQRDADSRTRLAIAVYTLAGMPRGATTDGAVAYRTQVAGESLVKAMIGRRGQTRLAFDVRLPTVSVSLSPTCYGTTASWRLDLGGGRAMSGRCSRRPEVDAGVPEAVIDGGPFAAAVRAGDTVRVRMRLTTAAADPGAVLGIGLYTHHVAHHTVAGQQLPDVLEESGHEWQAAGWRQSPVGARSLQVRVGASGQPQLVRYAEGGLAKVSTVTVRVGRGDAGGRLVTQDASSGGSGSSATAYVVQPGASASVTVEASRGATARGRLGLVTYRLVH